MTIHSSMRSSARHPLVLASSVLLASATLLACGSDPTPPRPDDGSGRQTEVVDDVVPWGEVTPTLVHVAGGDVEIVEGGVDGATVVFESGLGDDWTSWDAVAGEVAARARVFAYSRPGYGGSDPATAPRNATRIVEELRGLLAARGLVPPYVLVGHSFGGAYMELFAKAHPQEVAGLVLVEPRHRDFAATCEAAELDGCGIPDTLLALLPQTDRAEYEAFASTSEETRAAGGFGAYPVRVLTATEHTFEPAVEALWVSMHRSLADEAPEGEQIVFTGAGHLLQIERPHDVADVILTLVPASAPEAEGR